MDICYPITLERDSLKFGTKTDNILDSGIAYRL